MERSGASTAVSTASESPRGRVLALVDLLIALSTLAGITLWGAQYAYFTIFSQFQQYDDEGTMMLRVANFLKDPTAYDTLSGMYGPFYYLHKYAIYTLLDTPVSHDVNRLTTIAFWLLIAAFGAAFVYRMTHSIVLAAATHLQLLAHLSALIYEPGHPHEVSLLLITSAVLLSSFVDEGRGGLLALAGIGATAGALLLVKVNLGIYLAAPMALTILLCLRPLPLARGTLLAAMLVGLLVPPAVLAHHLHKVWGLHYDVLVTASIASGLVAAQRDGDSGFLRWQHVAAVVLGAVLTMAGVYAVFAAWDVPLAAIANSVVLRPLRLPDAFTRGAPMTLATSLGAAVSLLLASAYSFRARRVGQSDPGRRALAIGKVVYGAFVFYEMYRYGFGLLVTPFAVPFVWLVMVPLQPGDRTLAWRFPRIALGLTTAFQALQAYPVYGTQAQWSVLRLAMVAAVCIHDGLPELTALVTKGVRRAEARSWRRSLASLLLVAAVCTTYARKLDLPAARFTYEGNAPLGLAGASRIRLSHGYGQLLRTVVANLNAYCDAYVGMPGFASLYFWTRSPAPGILNNAWMINPDEEEQRAIADRMETYGRPCVLYNPQAAHFWLGRRPVDPRSVLAHYVRDNYKSALKTRGFQLLVKNDRPIPGTKLTL